MDPTANLKQQLDLARRLLASTQLEADERDLTRDADDLAERVIALATWIEREDFSPRRGRTVLVRRHRSLVRPTFVPCA